MNQLARHHLTRASALATTLATSVAATLAMLIGSALGAGPVAAQTFKDPALEALYVADNPAELQRVANQRLAAKADDDQAVLALALAALARDDTALRRQAIGRAEACVEKQPRAAACQYSLGVTLGVQAMMDGVFKAARSVGTVREALVAAHEIEPAWYPARSALLQFYLEAPGMLGGSSSKAAELARSAPRPEVAKALEARIAMDDKRWDAALQGLASLPANLDSALAEDVHSWTVQAALGLVNAGQAAKAQPALERLVREQPRQAGPAYALARVRGESGAHDEAIKLYEQAARQKDASNWPVAYRIGMSQQALGRLNEAKAAYSRFVATAKGPKNLLEDAKKRLAELGS